MISKETSLTLQCCSWCTVYTINSLYITCIGAPDKCDRV